MDGTVMGLNHTAVIETLKLYDEGRKMFEDILFCWAVEQEVRHTE